MKTSVALMVFALLAWVKVSHITTKERALRLSAWIGGETLTGRGLTKNLVHGQRVIVREFTVGELYDAVRNARDAEH